ncbi:hypothetical protein CBA19CS22_12380 [Caballeronia novacaledonica]|uniref:Uncharacterized protein n=1 Tax=Caballeronia novacaledonica TaxID=1544861 RepID=A0ACB5QRU3_9BURK|nr:hypothetical protein [Caballeronia sp. LZ029]MDR5747848.1 hypothetical protein [Caballeronia sp. LZ029]GJH17340.1 hypothetical protein CBA19CS22_12380 [Caballeronia novacaledonica]
MNNVFKTTFAVLLIAAFAFPVAATAKTHHHKKHHHRHTVKPHA